ncbi:MAG: guanylate kinase [Gammaproteobacteria bacterium]|nr:guanylate kinase [Gammaproteobacteria bacterium]
MRGRLLVVSAPSGAGKTSLVNALVQTLSGIVVSVSHTTRPPRAGEQNGVNYNFVDIATFQTLVAAGDMLEHAEVFGNYYGTSKRWVSDMLDSGADVLLEIDWQGARQVRALGLPATHIFILPPSREALASRLNARGKDSAEVIERRLAEALEEMSHYAEYDYLVVNDEFDEALADLVAIVRSSRLCLEYQRDNLGGLLARLMA